MFAYEIGVSLILDGNLGEGLRQAEMRTARLNNLISTQAAGLARIYRSGMQAASPKKQSSAISRSDRLSFDRFAGSSARQKQGEHISQSHPDVARLALALPIQTEPASRAAAEPLPSGPISSLYFPPAQGSAELPATLLGGFAAVRAAGQQCRLSSVAEPQPIDPDFDAADQKPDRWNFRRFSTATDEVDKQPETGPHAASRSVEPQAGQALGAAGPPQMIAYVAGIMKPGNLQTGYLQPAGGPTDTTAPANTAIGQKLLAYPSADTTPMAPTPNANMTSPTAAPTAQAAAAAFVAPAAPSRTGDALTAGAQGRPAAPGQSQQRDEARIAGDVYLDGALVGRWLSRHLADQAGRANAGPTGYDVRRGRTLPGTVIG